MKYKNIYTKNKMINHLILNGKKETGEKLLLRTLKEFQRTSFKQSKKLINMGIILSAPIFKLHKIKNKKKAKSSKEIPAIINNKKSRISLSIKFILMGLKQKALKHFYIALYEEIILNIKTQGLAISIKNNIQKQALLRKNFFYYYR